MASVGEAGAAARRGPSAVAVASGSDSFAIARGLVFGVLIATTLRFHPWDVTVIDEPSGTAWVRPLLPWVGMSTVVMVACAAVAMFGRWWPISGWAATGLGLVVLAVPQMDGKMAHYHNVLWFAAVICLGGDWLRASWVLLGWIYLLPGLAKLEHFDLLANGGFEYIVDGLRAENDRHTFVPAGSWFMVASLVVTIAIEVLFLPAMASQTGRRLAFAGGLLLHLGMWYVLDILFLHVFALYPLLLMEPEEGRRSRAPWVVVVVVIVASGAAGQRGWPFAVYPLFNWAPQG